jgi:uncharacterized peroxidase-related enzyme
MTRLNVVNPAEAQGETGAQLSAVKSKLGMVPNLLKVLANSPVGLSLYLANGDALAKGRFDGPTREAIALAAAGANNCDYCASAHTAISGMMKVPADEVTRRLAGHSADPKLDAALVFARAVVAKRGFVSDADLSAVRAAGHDDQAIVEIIANVVANIFTNYVNHIAQTDIDFPKVDTGAYKA